jgi:hypothetical protein
MDFFKLFSLTPQEVLLDNGNTVFVRRVRACESLDLKANDATEESLFEFMARLLVLTICDSEGKRLFADADIETIKQMDTASFTKLYEVALKVNAIGGEAQDDIKKK